MDKIYGFRRCSKTQSMKDAVRERLERGESVTLFVTESAKSSWDDLVREFPNRFHVWVPTGPLPINL